MALTCAAPDNDPQPHFRKHARMDLELAFKLGRQGFRVAVPQSEILMIKRQSVQHPETSDWVDETTRSHNLEVVDDLAYHGSELQENFLEYGIMQFASDNDWKVVPPFGGSAYRSNPRILLSRTELEQLLEDEPPPSPPTGLGNPSHVESSAASNNPWEQLTQTFLIFLAAWFGLNGGFEEPPPPSSAKRNRRPPKPDSGNSSLNSGDSNSPQNGDEALNHTNSDADGENKTSQNRLIFQLDKAVFVTGRSTDRDGSEQYKNTTSIDGSERVDLLTENVSYMRLDYATKQVPTIPYSEFMNPGDGTEPVLPSPTIDPSPELPTANNPGDGKEPVLPSPTIDPPPELPTVNNPGDGTEPVLPSPTIDPPPELPTANNPGDGTEPVLPSPTIDPPSELPTVNNPGGGKELVLPSPTIDPPPELPTVNNPGGGKEPVLPSPTIDPPPELPTVNNPGDGEEPVLPSPTIDVDGIQLIPVPDNVLLTIDGFGGVGRGVQPAPDILREVDILKFDGGGLIAKNMLLTKVGNDLVITFESVNSPKVVLKEFALEDIDNLPSVTGGLTPIGNIQFNGDSQIQDSFDVINEDAIIYQVWRRDTVTFLNDWDNTVSGYDNSNDVINGQSGHDILLGWSGNDVLRGGDGNDVLTGGDGNDVLTGGTGVNTLTGSEGADTFVLSSDGFSQVTDFVLGQDFIKLSDGIEARQIIIEQGTGVNTNNTYIKYNSIVLMSLSGVQANTLTIDVFLPSTLP